MWGVSEGCFINVIMSTKILKLDWFVGGQCPLPYNFKNVCCTQINRKRSIFIKCPNGSSRSEILKFGVIAIPGHCMHKDQYCICIQALVITGNWHPAQSLLYGTGQGVGFLMG